MEGIQKGVSLRTVQADIQMMRSDKLGYNAPIEVYDQKFYRYADPNYSITELPLTNEDVRLIDKAVDLLAEAEGFEPPKPFGFTRSCLGKRLLRRRASSVSPYHSAILPLVFGCKGTIPLCSLSA